MNELITLKVTEMKYCRKSRMIFGWELQISEGYHTVDQYFRLGSPRVAYEFTRGELQISEGNSKPVGYQYRCSSTPPPSVGPPVP